MEQRPLTRPVLLLACLWVLLGLLLPRAAHAGERIVLKLKWTHAFQFAGYYAAREKGFYREAGLDVTIHPGGAGEDSVQAVLDGQAEYGVGTSSLLLTRAEGKPVVALAAIFQHSPLVLVVRGDGPVRSIKDLAGRRVALEPQSEELIAALAKEGVPPGRFTLLKRHEDLDDLITGKIDAASAYITDEPYALEKAGIPFRTFKPRDLGVDFYGDTLFTTEQEVRDHPERVARFVAATLRGWKYALAHQDEMVDVILARYPPPGGSREHLRYEAAQMVPLVEPSVVEVGYMNVARWRSIAVIYAGLGVVPRELTLEGFMYQPPSEARLALARSYRYLGGAVALVIVVSLVTLRFVRTNRRLRAILDEKDRVKGELDDSEALFGALAKASPAGVGVFDGTAFISVNQAFTTITGHSEKELLAKDGLEFVASDQRAGVVDFLKPREDGLAMAGPLEVRLSPRSGEERLVEITRQCLTHRGRPVSSVTLIDVTERWRSIQEEKNRSRVLELIAWGAPQGEVLEAIVRGMEEYRPGTRASILVVDEDGQHLTVGAAPSLPDSCVHRLQRMKIAYASGSCGTAAFTGKRVFAEDLGTHPYWADFRDVAVEAGLEACWSEPVRSSTGRIVGTVSLYYPTPQSPESTLSPIDQTSRLIADLALMEQSANLTSIALERTFATRALRESEERYRLVAENSSDVIWTMDLQGRLTYVSPSIEKLRGYTVAEALQQPLEERFTPDSVEALKEVLVQCFAALNRGERFPEHRKEFEQPRKDGTTVWVEILLTGMYSPSGEFAGVLAVSRDVSKRREAEQALVRKNLQLQDLDREKNHLLGMAAHDLRSPLSTVHLCASYLLEEGPSLTESQQTVVGSIRDSTDFMLKLIVDILDVSQIQSGEIQLMPSVQEIGTVARHMVELNRILAERKKIGLDLCLEDGLPAFCFDPQKISQVLNNLVSNAIKFSLPDTRITVTVKRQDQEVLVSVRDQGRGIAKREMGGLFKPFSRTSTQSTGGEQSTGLGLYISQRLVAAHQGRIWAESEPTVGSTFSFTLPLGPCPETLLAPDREVDGPASPTPD